MARTTTPRRPLREGAPLWLATPPRLPAASDLPARCDVLVIGGGISGALVADALLAAGREVLAIDRSPFARSSTAASTAMLQFEMDQPLTVLARQIGQDSAIRAYWRSTVAMDQLRARIEDLGLRCGYRTRPSAYLPGAELGPKALREEAAARMAAGLRSVFIGRGALRERTGLEAAGAIWSTGSAEVDPVKLTAGLWRSAAERGASLAWPVEVTEVLPQADEVLVRCADGRQLRARHVVFATGYAVPPFLKLAGNRVVSTWAMATRPQPKALWPTRCLIWRAEDPYLYVRVTTDGRVVAGGEDEEFTDSARREARTEAKVARISAKLAKLLPGIDPRPEYSWSGCFGVSRTGLPSIGAIPHLPRCYALLGFGGNGITFSTLGAQLIQRLIAGMPDPDAGLYAPKGQVG